MLREQINITQYTGMCIYVYTSPTVSIHYGI